MQKVLSRWERVFCGYTESTVFP